MSWGKYPSIEERDLVHGTPIKVYKNGDPWFPGKRVVVNQRQHPTFESFLNYLTSTLKEERAVRRLYTPNHGTRITDYDQIKPENVYVTSHALGSNEHLKRIRWDVHTFFSISLTHFMCIIRYEYLFLLLEKFITSGACDFIVFFCVPKPFAFYLKKTF